MPRDQFTEALEPLDFAFNHCVVQGIEKTEITDTCSPISIVIDDDRESSLQCYEMLSHLKNAHQKARDRIDGISFVNDRSYPAVQAADMIAYESRVLMEARAKDPAAESTELFSCLTRWKTHQPSFYSSEKLDKWHRESLAVLEAKKNEQSR
jgi:hypothetical protein